MQESPNDQSARLDWHEGVPVSTRFDDPYYSLQDGLAETRHVFLAGNDLPERFRDGFHIAELGVGTGLNLLAAAALWQDSGMQGTLHYTGFEAFPMTRAEVQTALALFSDTLPAEVLEALLGAWALEGFSLRINGLEARMIIGDARHTLPAWDGTADAWFLDGFAPARNPELWEAPLLAQVAAHTAPGGSFATYTAAGAVRRALDAAGFDVARVPGYGRKRHMSRGTLRQR